MIQFPAVVGDAIDSVACMRFFAMIGRCSFLFLSFFLAEGVVSLGGDAQTLPTAETVLREYQALSATANQCDSQVHLRSQRMLLAEVSSDMKRELERLYGFSPLNPIYRENSVLYFKSHAALDWNVRIQPGSMRGGIVIQNSVTELSGSSPFLDGSDKSVLRRLTLRIPVQHPFALIVDPTQVETNISQFVLPQLIVDWHYLPRMWYPPVDKIGYPSDPESVRVRVQDDNLIAFIFTPTYMDNHLLGYLRTLTGMPNLGLSDLTNILLLDTLSFSCRSFSITIQSEGKQCPIFSITHANPVASPLPFPVPSVSTIMTSWRDRQQDQSVWAVNYFCQFTVVNTIDR